MALMAIKRASLLAVLLAAACSTKPSTTGERVVRDLMVASTCDSALNDWRAQAPTADVLLNAGSGLPANLYSVWGASGNAVWAVGNEGKVIFYDGQKWAVQATPTKSTLTSVWGTGPKDVWAAGFDGVVLHFDGVKWSDSSPPDLVFVPIGVDGGPPKGDAAVGFRRTIWSIWGFGTATTATQELYVVGEAGLVLYWAKSVWIAVAAGVEDRLNGVWGSGGTVTIVGDFGSLLTGNSGGLTKANTGTAKALLNVWGRGGNVYAIGVNGTFLHGSGGNWSAVDGLPKQVLKGMWGPDSDSSKMYVVGFDGTLLRMTGGPDFSNPTVDLFPCITKNRLDWVWGYEVPLNPVADSGRKTEEHIWAVGVSGTVLSGP
jgi:hypothetical protein